MGRVQHGGRTKGSAKSQIKAHKTKRYTRDLDQIASDISVAQAIRSLPFSPATAKVPITFGGTAHPTMTGDVDEDTPGGGLWACEECARWFADEHSLQGHTRSKVHKRRVKALKEGPYTMEEAMRAAGLGIDKHQRNRDQAALAKVAAAVEELKMI